jgi:hypothetical protein
MCLVPVDQHEPILDQALQAGARKFRQAVYEIFVQSLGDVFVVN